MRRTPRSVAQAVLAFTLSGLVVLLLVGLAGVLVLRRIGTAEAMREAENLTAIAARGVVQPRLKNGILQGSAGSRVAIDELVNGGVLRDPIVRIKIWDPEGRIVYSDDPDLIDEEFQLDAQQQEALLTNDVVASLSDLSAPQNRSEQGMGPLLDVSVPVSTPDGHELLFEASLRFDSVAASARRLWISFLPVLAAALVALAALQIPFAYRLARRVRESQLDREQLLQRAIDSSDLERRRIAADLHDGSVQQLAGLSLSLTATADSLADGDPGAADALREAASRTRQGIRSLRSAVMGIYPPDLQRAGLRAALSDLVAPLAEGNVLTEVDVPATLELPLDVESLLFRASQEAIRNIAVHARAAHVHIGVEQGDGSASLEVRDDGIGFSLHQREAAEKNGHLGLKLLDDLARDAGGTLSITSTLDQGTVLRLDVPVR